MSAAGTKKTRRCYLQNGGESFSGCHFQTNHPCDSNTCGGLVPRRSASDGCPVGSLRRRAPVQGPAGIVGAPVRFGKTGGWSSSWTGSRVSSGARNSLRCACSTPTRCSANQCSSPAVRGCSPMAEWLLLVTAGDAGDTGAALETPRGPLVESLMERGFIVRAINPKTARPPPGPLLAVGCEG